MATVMENLTHALRALCSVRVLNNVKTTPVDRSLWNGIRAQLILLYRLTHAIMAWRPTVVHIHTCSFNTFWRTGVDVLIARALGTPVAVHIHGAQFHKFLEGLGPRHRVVARLIFRLANRVIVLGEGWKAVVRPWISSEDRLWVLPNAVPVPEDAELAKADTTTAAPTILCLANYERRKGQEHLIKARATLPASLPLRLTFHGAGGDPGERERLQGLVRQLGLTERVDLEGPITGEDKHRAFIAAAAFCLPSYDEGLPMAMLEAMSYRLPVIVTAVGSIPEVVQNEVQGLVVAPGDEAGLAAALVRVAQDAPELATMGQRARNTVIENYSLRASATRLLALYGDLRD